MDNVFEEKDTPLSHAAKMAAANHLSRVTVPDNQFSEKKLLSTAKKFAADPAFRLIIRDKKTMDELNKGNADDFAYKVNNMRKDFNGIEALTVPAQDVIELNPGTGRKQ